MITEEIHHLEEDNCIATAAGQCKRQNYQIKQMEPKK